MYDINALVGYGSLWTFEMIFGHEKKNRIKRKYDAFAIHF